MEKPLDLLSTRIPPGLMARIIKWADTERRSLSQMARLLLEEALQRREAKKK